jgi:hypothetical protein
MNPQFQIAKCQSKLFGPRLNKLQRPDRLFRDIRALCVSPNNEEKRAHKETYKYASLHVATPDVQTCLERKRLPWHDLGKRLRYAGVLSFTGLPFYELIRYPQPSSKHPASRVSRT